MTETDIRNVQQKQWDAYISYLQRWAKEHNDFSNFGMSPVCFDEWEDNEGE